MAEYESMLLANPELDEEGVEAVKSRIEAIVAEGQGEIEKWELWGRRKLAYSIKKQTEAIYLLLYLKASPEVIASLKKSLKLDENFLRYMFIRKN